MTGPLSFDEVAARLLAAANTELVAINQLELQAARASTQSADRPEIYRLSVGEARRQAEALAYASHVFKHLAACPGFTFAMSPIGRGQ
ncbi:conserved hypothetical protein [Bosea sp. 62]|uniref:hypothetical protein n=1 Tax=unclassified Bosea (in: a-proteobacteria) TaxID=2653178 RepID=UPI001254309D|nr:MULTISPECIES: hypothetical protein [unclassified Bosea (in: a-proteobacteria)]CAD5255921.1 conserved hypothetical protein [Bosea sp. 7B]CAD5274801.1 conserved hypothetical protein [Bosea sp. 21B]CAD5275962.1 conserved hypothetical protein [Bosea sp. 46]VVT60061.1 conserved hypothetical protein [Bosea sp. EC-HK365B]VXB53542.1 conserved hypothetical protein [Bosea sp. 62]